MPKKYFEIDNTPEAGRVNTFLCHASTKKGILHFLNADIYPKNITIPNAEKFKTNIYVVKLFMDETKRANPDSLEYVPIKIESRSLSYVAILKKNYFPDGLKILEEAKGKLGRAVEYCFKNNIDISDCCKEISKEDYDKYYEDEIQQYRLATEELVKEREKQKIEEAKRDTRSWEIVEKRYSKEDGLFHIKWSSKKSIEWLEETYTDFDLFYKDCRKNLNGADLLNYNFEAIQLEKYKLDKAIISSEIMKRIGVYDDAVFKSIEKQKENAEFMPSESFDLVPTRIKFDAVETYPEFDKKDKIFLYLSDLHINHKLVKYFTRQANYYEVDNYLKDIVRSLKNTIPKSLKANVFLIGDISFDFEIFKRFMKIYSKEIFVKTFFILGNHELWDKTLVVLLMILLSNIESS